MLAHLIDHEKRQWKRKGADAEIFAAVVGAVVANLLLSQLGASPDASGDERHGWVRVPLSARRSKSSSGSRYDVSPMPLDILMSRREEGREERRGIVAAIADLGLIYLDRAPRHHLATPASAIKCRDGCRS